MNNYGHMPNDNIARDNVISYYKISTLRHNSKWSTSNQLEGKKIFLKVKKKTLLISQVKF